MHNKHFKNLALYATVLLNNGYYYVKAIMYIAHHCVCVCVCVCVYI